MDEQEKNLDRHAIEVKATFLQELIVEKNEQFNSKMEALKRYEGHVTGSKDLLEKISNYIKKQQSDVEDLVVQQKLTPEISNFVKAILEGTKSFVRLTCGDVEKIYFSKQGELLFIQQEAEKFAQQGLALDARIKQLDEVVKKQEESVLAQEVASAVDEITDKPKKKQRIRPDQDPTTKVGRAAMDLAERRRKNQKKITLNR